MVIGNVKLSGIKVGRIPRRYTLSRLSSGSINYYKTYDKDFDKRDLSQKNWNFGVEIMFENFNSYPVEIKLVFSKHTERNEDGSFLRDITPKEDAIRVPANEKVKGYVTLGERFPINQFDLRLQDVYIEEINIIGSGYNIIEKKENIHLQIYSKTQLLKASTLLIQRLYLTIINATIACILLVFLANDEIPFLVKSFLTIISAYFFYRILKIWRTPYDKRKSLPS